MNRDELERLIAGLPPSMMRPTRHANMFGFDRRWWDFHTGKAERHRRNLVALLRERFPVQLVHLDEDWYEGARATLREPVHMATTHGLWPVARAMPTEDLLAAVNEGRWTMYFYTDTSAVAPGVPDYIFVSEEEADERLRACGASCLISSWEDDVNWILAFDVRGTRCSRAPLIP